MTISPIKNRKTDRKRNLSKAEIKAEIKDFQEIARALIEGADKGGYEVSSQLRELVAKEDAA